MSYQDDFYAYLQNNRSALKSVLPVDPDLMTDEDIRILCNYATYRAGPSHYHMQGEKVDPQMLDDVRVFFNKQDTRQAALTHVKKAFTWFLSGSIRQPDLKRALFDQPKFSPAIERFIRKNQRSNWRDEFKSLSGQMLTVKTQVRGLLKLMKSDKPLKSPEMLEEIHRRLKDINRSMTKCDRMARAGVAWAQWEGVPIKSAIAGVHQVYLKNLPDFERAIKNTEGFLNSQGVRCNLGLRTVQRHQDWNQSIREIVDTVNNREKEKHHESTFAF